MSFEAHWIRGHVGNIDCVVSTGDRTAQLLRTPPQPAKRFIILEVTELLVNGFEKSANPVVPRLGQSGLAPTEDHCCIVNAAKQFHKVHMPTVLGLVVKELITVRDLGIP